MLRMPARMPLLTLNLTPNPMNPASGPGRGTAAASGTLGEEYERILRQYIPGPGGTRVREGAHGVGALPAAWEWKRIPQTWRRTSHLPFLSHLWVRLRS